MHLHRDTPSEPAAGDGDDRDGDRRGQLGAVTARLFAGLERQSRERRAVRRVPLARAATVAALCETLGLPSGVAGLMLVNGVHADPATRLADGDEVSLFPPVGGG